ncbi:MAG: carbon storage regulator [Planctomycetia bacterium]|nr:carbon storage regulator [Planctomycetia bacterium]
MLVLSRKEGETLCIGDDIRITVTRITGNKVRIGIETLSDISILRGELRENDFNEQEEMSSFSPGSSLRKKLIPA